MRWELAIFGLYVLGFSHFGLASVTIVTENGVEFVKEWEKPDENELQTHQALSDIVAGAMDVNYKKKGLRILRDAHPKSHGCFVAKFTVEKNLDEDLRVGVFIPGKTYDAIIRSSSLKGVVQSDAISDGRAIGLKLFGVPGKKLAEQAADAKTQDFIMTNLPVFPASNPEEFRGIVSAVARYDSPVKFFFPSLDPATWKVRSAAASLAPVRRGDEGSVLFHQHYFSQIPQLLGDKPVKYSARSCGFPNDKVERPANPADNFLRQQAKDHLAKNTACFDFLIQRYKPGFAIEDGLGWWPSGDDTYFEPVKLLRVASPGDKPTSPFIKVARIEILKQDVDLDMNSPRNIYCDNLTIDTWHSIPAHRSLGGLNRARKSVYKFISEKRHQENHRRSPTEPESVQEYLSIKPVN